MTELVQKIYEAGAGPEAGKWAMKMDASLDSALELLAADIPVSDPPQLVAGDRHRADPLLRELLP